MSELGAKIRNIIQYAAVTLASKDDEERQIAQSDALGKTLQTNVFYPYGLSANAPTGSILVRFLMGGSMQNSAAIATNSANRFKGLKEWEVAVGNFIKKSKIFFDEDGNIEIDAGEFDKDITLKPGNGKVKIEGDLDVSGDIVANGEVSANSLLPATKVTLSGHSHTTPSGPSGPPIIPEP
ncbi:MAG: phage baseplate assembly protein [Candidatus Peribacteraceae bacterium]|nr:phage baseplate assembly protein [Candidatus Peribacteraceae bacterium]